jgi:hypothetical protein
MAAIFVEINPTGDKMEKHDVTIFSPYPFKVGDKIYIDGGRRKGDWEVVALNDGKVKLKCPVSLREFEFNRFCYFAKKEKEIEWPRKDS